MSKFVKDLITDAIRGRFGNADSALLVSVAGMTANNNSLLRKKLREKNIQLMVIKNSLARRAAEGTPLAAAFGEMEGALAVVWGAEDVVSLAKEVTRLTEDKAFALFEARGGVMDGARLTSEEVKAVSKWPTREEQLSILLGQIMSPGANLVSQLTSVGGALASQIKQKSEGEGTDGESASAEAPAGDAPASDEPAAPTAE